MDVEMFFAGIGVVVVGLLAALGLIGVIAAITNAINAQEKR